MENTHYLILIIEIIGLFIIGIVGIIVPIYVTIKNILNILLRRNFTKKRLIFNIVSIIICLIYSYMGFSYVEKGVYGNSVYLDYNVSTPIEIHNSRRGEVMYHAPIASWSLPTVLTILALGIIAYLILRINKKKMAPLITVALLSCTLICSIYMLLFIIQVAFAHINFHDLLLLIFPINYILCTIKLQIDIINKYKNNEETKQYSNKYLNKISNILCNAENWKIGQLIIAIPVLTIMICILLLFGQRPDEAIRAFLETSDWNLSTFVSQPMPIEYVGHYLCTVSLKGHKKIVKPTRIGIRYGNKIIVNRQLCIANAFEDLIKEKTPRFHYLIRTIYDKYGYPLSKHINKPWQADLIYIIMKPLEWLFLITLYLFDVKPENRIAVQYIGNNKII